MPEVVAAAPLLIPCHGSRLFAIRVSGKLGISRGCRCQNWVSLRVAFQATHKLSLRFEAIDREIMELTGAQSMSPIMIDPNAMAVVQPELTSGENVLWAGRPAQSAIFHREDLYLIPFSLLWGGFAMFWEAAVMGFATFGKAVNHAPAFFQLWGIPFVVAGQYLIWGRFLYSAWLKQRTYYAVTDRRVIAVQNNWGRRVASSYIDTLPMIAREGGANGRGVLRFAPVISMWSRQGGGWGAWNNMRIGETPTFMDIEDVNSVYQLVSDLREKARTVKT